MNILVTGGAGFIGSNLADELLRQEHRVTVVDNFNDYYDPRIKEANVAGQGDDERYAIVNLGGGEPIALSRMISTIENALGRQAMIVRKPMQPGDVVKTACDWSKARRLLGYRPSVSFEEGIREFVQWWNGANG